MKKLIMMMVCGLTLGSSLAQPLPKWAQKAGKAVFSVVTYNKDNKIMNTGNGFYIDEKGTGVSDYTLFKEAHHAVIVNSDGKELPVECILGANYLYDVVKFRVNNKKKNMTLVAAPKGAAANETVYLLPYSTQKSKTGVTGKVNRVDTISNHSLYFTMDMTTSEKAVSCPIMNAEGQVIGLLQKSSDEDKTKSYAIGIDFAQALEINALSGNDAALNSIGIKKALPEKEDQALVYMYMNSSRLKGEAYLEMLNEFVMTFPKSVEGYARRASYYASLNTQEGNNLAQEDLEAMNKECDNEAEAHYQTARFCYTYGLLPDKQKSNKEWTLEMALKEVNEALTAKQEPGYIQTKGDILFAMQKYQEAYEAYSALNKTAIASAATFYSAAKSLEMAEGSDKKEVVALMDSAVSKYNLPYGKDAAPYLLERARMKMIVEDYRGAVKDYNSFYDAMLGQVAHEFYFYRQSAEMQSKMYPQAIADINKAVELAPDNVDYLLEKASIHIRVGQLDEAVEALNKTIRLAPKNGAAYRMLGYTMIRQKNKKEGMQYLHKAKELGDEVAGGLIDKYKKK